MTKLKKSNKKLSEPYLSAKDAINYLWCTKDGEIIPLTKLSDTHLKGIVKLMDATSGWRVKQRPYIDAEIKRRKRLKLAKQTLAGKLLYGNN